MEKTRAFESGRIKPRRKPTLPGAFHLQEAQIFLHCVSKPVGVDASITCSSKSPSPCKYRLHFTGRETEAQGDWCPMCKSRCL